MTRKERGKSVIICEIRGEKKENPCQFVGNSTCQSICEISGYILKDSYLYLKIKKLEIMITIEINERTKAGKALLETAYR